MATILALDLGKFKTVALCYDSDTHAERFETVRSTRAELQQLLERQPADQVVIEACTLAGWVHDLCRECGRQVLVANTNGEAWKFKNVKRKTDRDDARKLAQLAALGQLPVVTLPDRRTRQKRSLLGYRQRLVSRRTAVQNRIRALLLSQGRELSLGHHA